jgi:hypothetical protein
MLSPDQKGNIAEAAIAFHAVRMGVPVYRPLFEGGRYDLILELDGRLVRVQCKWAARYDEVLIIRCARNRRTRDGLLCRTYTVDEIDAFAAYSVDLDRCYYLPLEDFLGMKAIQLRIAPTRNNQRRRIRWAETYEFGATLAAPGAVAQLGERQSGTLEVRGSIPLGSTSEAAA